jgi:hypothetical protein
MQLSNVDRERMQDSMLKIQSIRASLGAIDDGKIPNASAVHECLNAADESLKEALGYKKPGEHSHNF